MSRSDSSPASTYAGSDRRRSPRLIRDPFSLHSNGGKFFGGIAFQSPLEMCQPSAKRDREAHYLPGSTSSTVDEKLNEVRTKDDRKVATVHKEVNVERGDARRGATPAASISWRRFRQAKRNSRLHCSVRSSSSALACTEAERLEILRVKLEVQARLWAAKPLRLEALEFRGNGSFWDNEDEAALPSGETSLLEDETALAVGLPPLALDQAGLDVRTTGGKVAQLGVRTPAPIEHRDTLQTQPPLRRVIPRDTGTDNKELGQLSLPVLVWNRSTPELPDGTCTSGGHKTIPEVTSPTSPISVAALRENSAKPMSLPDVSRMEFSREQFAFRTQKPFDRETGVMHRPRISFSAGRLLLTAQEPRACGTTPADTASDAFCRSTFNGVSNLHGGPNRVESAGRPVEALNNKRNTPRSSHAYRPLVPGRLHDDRRFISSHTPYLDLGVMEEQPTIDSDRALRSTDRVPRSSGTSYAASYSPQATHPSTHIVCPQYQSGSGKSEDRRTSALDFIGSEHPGTFIHPPNRVFHASPDDSSFLNIECQQPTVAILNQKGRSQRDKQGLNHPTRFDAGGELEPAVAGHQGHHYHPLTSSPGDQHDAFRASNSSKFEVTLSSPFADVVAHSNKISDPASFPYEDEPRSCAHCGTYIGGGVPGCLSSNRSSCLVLILIFLSFYLSTIAGQDAACL